VAKIINIQTEVFTISNLFVKKELQRSVE